VRVTAAGGFLAVLILAGASFAGCRGPLEAEEVAPTIASTWTPPSAVTCGHANGSIDRGPYLIAGIPISGYGFPDMGTSKWDMALNSTGVAVEVLAKEPGVFTMGDVNRSPSVYTPFEVEVTRVLHGRATTGRSLITVEGGTAGCYVVHVDAAPRLEVGGRYVLFMGDPALGSDLGEAWVAWPMSLDGTVQTAGGPMAIDELAARIARLEAAESPTPERESSVRP
jgi:hypothetical protein